MNLKSKHKGNLVADGCADVSVAEILYGFVEVLCTERKFTLAVVDHYLLKKFIPIGMQLLLTYQMVISFID